MSFAEKPSPLIGKIWGTGLLAIKIMRIKIGKLKKRKLINRSFISYCTDRDLFKKLICVADKID